MSSREYEAPILELKKEPFLEEGGGKRLMDGILKPSVLRQPLIHATDSLARASIIFGGGENNSLVDHETRSKAILSIFNQMCTFYGAVLLFPVFDLLSMICYVTPPTSAPDFGSDVHCLGVDSGFWLSLERIHSAAKAFDRELWAENKVGSSRVWDMLVVRTGNHSNIATAKDSRYRLFREIEERGESCILKALDAICVHVEWILNYNEGKGRNKVSHSLINLLIIWWTY